MPHHNTPDWFDNLDEIIAEPLKFKAKLHIGEDAYDSLLLKKRAGEAWDIVGAAGAGAVVASSTTIASTFFPATGFLAWLGIGAIAVTPVGWVAAAAIVSAGTWYGLSQAAKKYSSDKVVVIPAFLNTPMDVLALTLFDLMAPLALKIAVTGGNIHEEKKAFIKRYFINEWGYDESFIDKGFEFTEDHLSNFSIRELAKTLAEFQKINRDCNFEAMANEINSFLRNVMETDGKVDECKDIAIEKVNQIFFEVRKNHGPMYVFHPVSRFIMCIFKTGKRVWKSVLRILK